MYLLVLVASYQVQLLTRRMIERCTVSYTLHPLHVEVTKQIITRLERLHHSWNVLFIQHYFFAHPKKCRVNK